MGVAMKEEWVAQVVSVDEEAEAVGEVEVATLETEVFTLTNLLILILFF